jgi:hypothetical protein
MKNGSDHQIGCQIAAIFIANSAHCTSKWNPLLGVTFSAVPGKGSIGVLLSTAQYIDPTGIARLRISPCAWKRVCQLNASSKRCGVFPPRALARRM